MKVSDQLHAPAALPPGKSPSIHWIGGWMGPTTGLEAVGKTSLAFAGTLNSHLSVVQPVDSLYTD
jgi:hypothetical protein